MTAQQQAKGEVGMEQKTSFISYDLLVVLLEMLWANRLTRTYSYGKYTRKESLSSIHLELCVNEIIQSSLYRSIKFESTHPAQQRHDVPRYVDSR